MDVVVVLDDLCADEAALKVCVDDSGTLGSLPALAVGPGFHLHLACCDERLKVQQLEGCLDEAVDARFLKTNFFKEHLTVLIAVQLCNVSLCLCCQHHHLGRLILHSLTHSLHIGIPRHSTPLVHIAHIEYGLGSQQEKVVGCTLFILRVKGYCAGTLSLDEGLVVLTEHIQLQLGLLVTPSGGLLLHLLNTLFNGLQVFDLQLSVNDFLVTHRVHTAVNMGHIVVVEAAQHMDDGITLADVSQEFVSQSFTLRGPLHQTGNVHNLHRSRDNPTWVDKFSQAVKPLIGDCDDTNVWFDGAEREVGCLSLSA